MKSRLGEISKGKIVSAVRITKTATVKTKAPVKALAVKKAIFELSAPQAKKVAVTGDFKSWDASGIPMKKEKNGVWRTEVSLKPGRYEYKFIVDSQWWTDPANAKTAANTCGSLNSVKEIAA